MKRSEELTLEIKRLEGIDEKPMTERERAIHLQKIKDAYWARRRCLEREENIPPVTHSNGMPV